MTKSKSVQQRQKYADFIEELKFAFVMDALQKGEEPFAVMLAADRAIADEFEQAANMAVRLMRCDVGVVTRSFVGEGAELLFRHKGKRYGARFMQSAADYLVENYPLHFANLDAVVRHRWIAELMRALVNRDYDKLLRQYASHFEINPDDPTAPYAPGRHPTALRSRIVAVLTDRRSA